MEIQSTFADELRDIQNRTEPFLSEEKSVKIFRTSVKKLCLRAAKDRQNSVKLYNNDSVFTNNKLMIDVKTIENIFQEFGLEFKYWTGTHPMYILSW